jgi:hypothetical protein
MSQLLEDAIALQELFSDDKTWIQEDLWAYREDRGQNCYCMLGGIDHVTGLLDSGDDWSEPYDRSKALQKAVESVLVETYPDWVYSSNHLHIPDWNDAENRTVQDVQDVCTKTVEKVRGTA